MSDTVPALIEVTIIAFVVPAVAALGYALMVGWAALVYGGRRNVPESSIKRKRVICAGLVAAAYLYMIALAVARHKL